MMIDVRCSSCKEWLKISEEYRGQSGKCAKCGCPVKVPRKIITNRVAVAGVCVLIAVSVMGQLTSDKKPIAAPTQQVVVADHTPTPVKPAPVVPPAHPTIEEAITKALGKNNREGAPLPKIIERQGELSVSFAVGDNLTKGFIIGGAQLDTLAVLEKAHEIRPGSAVSIQATFPLVDAYGNSSEEVVFTVQYSPLTLAKINFENIPMENVWRIADSAVIHPTFR